MTAPPTPAAGPATTMPRQHRRPSALLWWGLGLLTAFVLMGVVVAAAPAAPFTQAIDDAWRTIAGVGPDSDAYTWFVPMAFQFLGEVQGALVALLVPVLLLIVGRWRSALFFLAATVAAAVLSQLAKNLVHRPRPADDEVLGLFGPLFSVDHGSFPSGHVVTMTTLVLSIAALIPRSRAVARRVWWVCAAVLVAGMIWQRTLVNAHWLSDALFGAVGGAAATLLLWWAFWPWLTRDHERPVWFLRGRAPGERPALAPAG